MTIPALKLIILESGVRTKRRTMRAAVNIMDSKSCQLLFASGGLRRAVFEPYPMAENTWFLEVTTTSGETHRVTKTRTSEVKLFKSIQSVTNEAKKIGFDRAEILLGN